MLREDVSRDELRLAGNALGRMGVLITELLELARGDREIGETTAVALNAVGEDARRNVSTPEAEVAAPEADVRVMADESRLQQLFENLFRNAVDHGGAGVRLTVDTTADGFSVADDGPGIPPDKCDRALETGYMAAGRGTGFGLSIVQQIVARHSWEIQVTESADGGAKFEITCVEFDA